MSHPRTGPAGLPRPEKAYPPRLGPPALYLRSRALPGALAALVGVAVAAAWVARWLESLPGLDHTARLPVVVFGPLVAAAAVGTSLYAP
ncbi:hypothetical protein R6L23_37250, partial [Streptomyces sp. SR27]|nr:hypothetical protein [Streptomyces sp. SR27]